MSRTCVFYRQYLSTLHICEGGGGDQYQCHLTNVTSFGHNKGNFVRVTNKIKICLMRGYLLPFTLNIFGSNIGHLKKSDFYLMFVTLRNEKSSHTAISFLFSNGKKNIFQLFYYLNGRFLNKKCSLCTVQIIVFYYTHKKELNFILS